MQRSRTYTTRVLQTKRQPLNRTYKSFRLASSPSSVGIGPVRPWPERSLCRTGEPGQLLVAGSKAARQHGSKQGLKATVLPGRSQRHRQLHAMDTCATATGKGTHAQRGHAPPTLVRSTVCLRATTQAKLPARRRSRGELARGIVVYGYTHQQLCGCQRAGAIGSLE